MKMQIKIVEAMKKQSGRVKHEDIIQISNNPGVFKKVMKNLLESNKIRVMRDRTGNIMYELKDK